MLILIAGIPGTGKTTIGNYLEKHYGYHHLDVEDFIRNFSHLPDFPLRGDFVGTWGFMPNETQFVVIDYLRKNGYVLFWFDGDRKIAFNHFIERERKNNREIIAIEEFNRQIARIDEANVINRLKPIILNPFEENGSFRRPEVIIKDILNFQPNRS